MKKDKFIALLTRKLSGGLADTELALLEQTLKENETYKILAIELEGYLNQQQNHQPAKQKLEQIWQKIDADDVKVASDNFDFASPRGKLFTYNILVKVAAILLLGLGVGVFNYRQFFNDEETQLVTASANSKVFKTLNDGTKVWLNKESTISYNTEFGKHKREIVLEGEAYFDVVKNTNVPLIIHVAGIDIRVMGTAFNVNAIKERDEVEVALIRGRIEVTDRMHDRNHVQLRPNEKLIFSNSALSNNEIKFKVISLASNVLLNDIKWTSDTLTFRKEKLKDLALRMERKYDLKIEVRSKNLSEKRFSGTFINETIQQALAALQLSYPLTYTINNRLVVIAD